MTALPTTEVFAFSAPKSKAGEIAIAVNVGAGALHVLHATRSVWRNLFERLAAEFAPLATAPLAAPKPGEGGRAVVRRLHGKQRHVVFFAVLTHMQKAGLTQKKACAEARVSLGAFGMWLRAYRRSGYRPPSLDDTLAECRAPICKPNGRLL